MRSAISEETEDKKIWISDRLRHELGLGSRESRGIKANLMLITIGKIKNAEEK